MTTPRKVVILGAAGRDFHNFNTVYRNNPDFRVVAFTATQIPDIAGRKYPAELAGELYPEGIPILDEADLDSIIKDNDVDVAVFSYSDVKHEYVGHLYSQVNAAGADFELLSPARTMIKSTKPVIAICAVRTGVGKSQTTRYISSILKEMGKKVVAIRHPMPYGDLAKQAVQRFENYADLDKHETTIEEREEYEPHIDNGFVVYAGVDYEAIIREAEKEADVILWDGGNNDVPFYAADLHFVLADPLRAGHESLYHPGETNVRMADVVLVNKCDSAKQEDIDSVVEACKGMNPEAAIYLCDSPVTVEDPELVKGKKVVVIEDGPTLTHGSMSYGAGVVGAKAAGVGEIIDPTPYAVGTIADTYKKYPNAEGILPAMGYGEAQVKDLEATIEATPAEAVVSGTPIDITRILKVSKPMTRARYELKERELGKIEGHIKSLLS